MVYITKKMNNTMEFIVQVEKRTWKQTGIVKSDSSYDGGKYNL